MKTRSQTAVEQAAAPPGKLLSNDDLTNLFVDVARHNMRQAAQPTPPPASETPETQSNQELVELMRTSFKRPIEWSKPEEMRPFLALPRRALEVGVKLLGPHASFVPFFLGGAVMGLTDARVGTVVVVSTVIRMLTSVALYVGQKAALADERSVRRAWFYWATAIVYDLAVSFVDGCYLWALVSLAVDMSAMAMRVDWSKLWRGAPDPIIVNESYGN